MSAQDSYRIYGNKIYFHIFNKGVENRIIFNDAKDYEVYLMYLEEYLTPPEASEKLKKTFTVNGKTFKGTPHLPKNYFGKIELLAYNLLPNHFHLVLQQIEENSIQGLMRSLCTRYSMYFNKKYNRSGPLFQGAYKSAIIKDQTQLLHLVNHIHKHSDNSAYSSHSEYLNPQKPHFVKNESILSLFSQPQNPFKGIANYKQFSDKYHATQEENKALEMVLLEDKDDHLARIIPESSSIPPTTTDHVLPIAPQVTHHHTIRLPEIVGAAFVFLLLTAFSAKNIAATQGLIITISTPGPKANVLSATTPPIVLPTPNNEQPKLLVVITSSSDLNINIHQEKTLESEQIGTTYPGDTFEMISQDPQWYEIKLPDGSTGFVSTEYAQLKEYYY